MDTFPSAREAEAAVQPLEAAKWHPSSLGGRDALLALYAEDAVTVEYGAEPHGGFERKADIRAALGTEDGGRLVAMLDATAFELSEWCFVHPAPGAVVASYRVRAPAFAWDAYATSVWAWRSGRWQTVFYQASRAAGSPAA
jgi:hypothetical protein